MPTDQIERTKRSTDPVRLPQGSYVDEQIRILDDILKLHSQVSDCLAYELEDERFQKVQAHWETFGPVSIFEDPDKWLLRLRSTADLCDRLLCPGTWNEVIYAGVNYQRAQDFIRQQAMRAEWNRIHAIPSPSLRHAALKNWWAKYDETRGGSR